jgi:hypothetical protein
LIWLAVSNIFYVSISYMGCHPKPIDELHHFSRRLKPPTRNDPSFARSLSKIFHGMKVLAAVDTFLPTSADLSDQFSVAQNCTQIRGINHSQTGG